MLREMRDAAADFGEFHTPRGSREKRLKKV
jgi:hypothetical protein